MCLLWIIAAASGIVASLIMMLSVWALHEKLHQVDHARTLQKMDMEVLQKKYNQLKSDMREKDIL